MVLTKRSLKLLMVSTGWLGCTFFGLHAPKSASATPPEKFPIVGSVSTGISWNHSNFVGAESDQTSGLTLPSSQGFGWSILSMNTSLSYSWQFSDDLEPLFFSGSLGFERALSEGFNRAGVIPNASTQPHRFYVNDLSLSAGWTLPGVGRVIDGLIANFSVNADIPFSTTSRALGVQSYLSTFLSLIYPTPIKLVIQGSVFVGYNVLDHPTQQVDCTLTPQVCRISGEDLGSPNDLMYWGGALNMQYPLFGGLRLGMTYRMFGSLLAVTFPDTETDPYASPYAQSGPQVGSLIHGTTVFLQYGFNRAGSAAQQALNDSIEGQGKKKQEESFLNRLSLSLSMTTNDRFYSSDGSRITVPVFDFETDNRSRTVYAFSVLVTL